MTDPKTKRDPESIERQQALELFLAGTVICVRHWREYCADDRGCVTLLLGLVFPDRRIFGMVVKFGANLRAWWSMFSRLIFWGPRLIAPADGGPANRTVV